jgi:TonB family protein
MHRFARTVLALILLASVCVSAAEPPSADALDDFDQSLTRFKRDIWNVQRLTSMFGRDFRGRMLNDDLRDFVLPKATEAELQKQRTLVEKQIRARHPDAQNSLRDLNRIVIDENSRLDIIFMHRLQFRQLAHHRDLWRENSERAPNYRTPKNIERLELEAVTRLNAGQFAEVIDQVYPALQRAYAAERNQLEKYQPVTVGAKTYYSRRTPCGEPAKGTTGKPYPALANKSFPQYPDESRRSGEEGNVLVNVLVSDTGCATSYAIASSSGWPALDDAALDWLETVSFKPALTDGKAAAVYVTLPVNFKLDD